MVNHGIFVIFDLTIPILTTHGHPQGGGGRPILYVKKGLMGVALSEPHELRAGSPGLSHVHMDLRDHFPLEVRTSRLQRARAQATKCTTPFSYSMGMGPNSSMGNTNQLILIVPSFSTWKTTPETRGSRPERDNLRAYNDRPHDPPVVKTGCRAWPRAVLVCRARAHMAYQGSAWSYRTIRQPRCALSTTMSHARVLTCNRSPFPTILAMWTP